MKHNYLSIIFIVFISLAGAALVGQGLNNGGGTLVIHTQKQDLKVFPNPASSVFSLNDSNLKLKYISINNIIGKEVKRVKVTPENAYDISELQRGIYIVRIFNQSDELVKALRLSKS